MPAPSPRISDPHVAALQGRVWKAVVERFAACRERRGLTQADLGRSLGVPRSQISAWFRRPEQMTLKAAARLLAVMDAELRVDLADLDPTREDAPS